jgi:hypothetical protein
MEPLVGKVTPINEMTSSSSSGGPKQGSQEEQFSQEMEDSVCKASPRKVNCPPYRGIGVDFSFYTRLMLDDLHQLP